MGRGKEQFIEATGGFLADPMERMIHQRLHQLKTKLGAEGLTEEERQEFLRLFDGLPDDDEFCDQYPE